MRSVLTLPFLAGLATSLPSPAQQPFSLESDLAGERVNVSLYVMSRCPDARLCENVFQSVIQQEGILDKIDLNVGYIGTPNKTEPLGVTCKHGQIECIGNAHQICLYEHLPVDKAYAVVQCQNYPSTFPKEIGSVESIQKCVKTVGIDWVNSGVGKCIQGKNFNQTLETPQKHKGKDKPEGGGDDEVKLLGKEATQLLKRNIKEVYDKGITTSCTIDIDSTVNKAGKRRCVVDGGVWKGCDDGHTAQDFIRVIEEEYKNLQSKKDE
ncbi:uncharacterized protein I303_101347 [Kwoniella dejecticola CBS 10117]|uniref:Gamma-interferon-inducible lysosomal thiol reductase n=1 Tax=Kwoniella dejecticola CBS 10117 TaxID=1296121 RepID=A0A1A6AHP0_9TREE|nr:uncharacterized protein I303_01356 [Kwoniella dejecticola CBS 10117]OBR89528.1 hypothetical protein I303_01356 [Kwoniella dejecticola CBS 10117]